MKPKWYLLFSRKSIPFIWQIDHVVNSLIIVSSFPDAHLFLNESVIIQMQTNISWENELRKLTKFYLPMEKYNEQQI